MDDSDPNMAARGGPRLSEEILAKAQRYAKKTAAARAARRQRFEQMRPTPRQAIVAWVDLLGFRDQIHAAKTPEEFQAAYRRIREVQEEFAKDTASTEPDQAAVNFALGKRILALSDGLVIALDLEEDSPAAEIRGYFERVRSFLGELLFAQARCAYAGNFVRGGIAEGYFWFEDDILLSPALVEAYKMETEVARNPVIILQRALAEKLRLMEADEGETDNPYPLNQAFRDCEWLSEFERTNYVMLHFMPDILDEDNPAPILLRFLETLSKAREKAPECFACAKAKYDWLIKYAREAEDGKAGT